MATFEVDAGGKTFEVEAPDLQSASAALTQHFNAPAPAPEAPALGFGGTLADIAHSAGTGVAKGVIGLGGLPAVAADLGSQFSDWAFGTNANPGAKQFVAAAGPEALQKRVEANIGPFYQPKTWLGQGAQTIGEFLPAAAGGPEGLLARVATRAVLPAVASEAAGAATAGTPLEGPARVGGALLGGLSPAAARRIATPFPLAVERAGAVQTLANEGVQVPAGMAVGSKALKATESELGGQNYAAKIEQMNEQFTQAALKRAGIDASRGTPDVLNAAADRIGTAFDEVAARNPKIPIPGFAPVADAIAGDFQRLTGTENPYLNELRGRLPATISGDTYQAVQSEMRRLADRSSSPELKGALYDMKTALDKAVQSGLKDPADAAAWAQARKDWKNLLVIKNAVSGPTETSAGGLITPSKLTQAIKSVGRKDDYVMGRGAFSDLARAGNQVMKAAPDSGTASRLTSRAIPAAIGATAAGGFAHLPMIFASALAPSVAGHVLLSKPVQAYLRNQKFVGRAGNVRRNVGAIAPSGFVQGQR